MARLSCLSTILHPTPAAKVIPLSVVPAPAKPVAPVTMELTQEEGAEIRTRALAGAMPAGSPTLFCQTCLIGPECPKYDPQYVCAFEDGFRGAPTRDIHDVTTLVAQVVEENMLRFRRSRLHEDMVQGGEIDPKTTKLASAIIQQAKVLADMIKTKKSMKVEGQGEGILSQVFGKLLTPQTAPKSLLENSHTHEIIEVTPSHEAVLVAKDAPQIGSSEP